ncbi:AGE family epimerase/isomerase [Paraglaciecola marina]|uniref:AGE family epimerase/isomerase n=1 Tax=Paraglaciecola marina TaxID=2500157 RepID=UPI00197CDBA8|nr:AGE family epimerase/isomerase [Paraglaciecola marina]
MDIQIDFKSERFLRTHIQSILDFYLPNIVDKSGGFFHNFKDDGSVFNPHHRHLVSSCRMVWIFCKAYELYGDEEYLSLAKHGVDYIRSKHWDDKRQGYNWLLGENHLPTDQTNHCYGLAFVILCFSAAHKVGIENALFDLQRAHNILHTRLWDKNIGMFADEASSDWSEVNSYRGQNANMHCCEAFVAAYEATADNRYLDIACQLARKVSIELADKAGGIIWEHYSEQLEIDWEYNKDDPKNLYRPWGFQPGHLTEWAKLLLILHDYRPETWMVDRAKFLFDKALDVGWDTKNGGIFYGFGPDGSICDDEKYFWVQSETTSAAIRLEKATGDTKYSQWYQKIWEYAWQNMVDHQYGAWYRILTADNQKLTDEKSTAGGKCDYHTIGAFWDILRVLKQ